MPFCLGLAVLLGALALDMRSYICRVLVIVLSMSCIVSLSPRVLALPDLPRVEDSESLCFLRLVNSYASMMIFEVDL
jgi:hypothetical protein